jgi:hypothetical protein
MTHEHMKKTLRESRKIEGARGKKTVQKPKSALTIAYVPLPSGGPGIWRGNMD